MHFGAYQNLKISIAIAIYRTFSVVVETDIEVFAGLTIAFGLKRHLASKIVFALFERGLKRKTLDQKA